MKISSAFFKPIDLSVDKFPELAIVLLHATRIPPHLILVIDNKVWSYGLKGVSAGIDLQIYLDHIRKTNMKVIGFELPVIVKSEELIKAADKFYNIPEPVSEQGPTCFTPIKKIAELIFNQDFSDHRFYFHLINHLILNEEIKKAFHINMEMYFLNHHFELSEYNEADLRSGINAYRKTSS